MFEGMAGQGSVVYFDIYLEVLVQIVGLQETYYGFSIHVILVLGRFHRFRLNQEGTGKAFGACIVAGDGQHLRQVFFFTFLVGVQQRHIAFTSAPEHIVVGTTQFDSSVDSVLDLDGGTGYHVEVRIGGGTVHVTRVAEYVGRTPQQLDACFGLFLFQVSHDFLHVRFVFFNRVCFVAEVYIVEAVIFDTDFLHDFEACVSLVLSSLYLVGVSFPGELLRAASELVAAFSAQRVPPSHGEFQPVFHLLSHYHSFGVIITESQRVLAFYTFEFDFTDTRKILFCCHSFFV